jgi:hypothetical protein
VDQGTTNALWGLRTQPSKPTGQSPYFLVYGSEAILPADVIWNSPAVEHYDEGVSEDATTTATSRNAPSTLAISSSVVSRTRKDYTSSAPPGKVPSQLQR